MGVILVEEFYDQLFIMSSTRLLLKANNLSDYSYADTKLLINGYIREINISSIIIPITLIQLTTELFWIPYFDNIFVVV